MTILQDIATGLTGSMAVDGSTAFTGAVNFNGQPVSGIGNLSIGGTFTAPAATIASLYVSSGANITALTGPLNANNQNITNFGVLTGSSTNITTLGCSALNVSSVAYIPVLGQQLNANNNNIIGVSTLSAATVSAGTLNGNLNSGYVFMNGDIELNGHTLDRCGYLNMYGDIQMNGHNIAQVNAVTGVGSGAISFWNDLSMSGHNIFNGGDIHCVNIYAQNFIPSTRISQPLAAVRALAEQPVGELDLVETLSTLIAAVAELAAVPA